MILSQSFFSFNILSTWLKVLGFWSEFPAQESEPVIGSFSAFKPLLHAIFLGTCFSSNGFKQTYFSQSHNFELSKVTGLFMCNSRKGFYKGSSFWRVLTKPLATSSCNLCYGFIWSSCAWENLSLSFISVKMIQFPNRYFERSSSSNQSGVTILNSILYRSFTKAH